MEPAHVAQTTSRFDSVAPRRSALHLIAEIRATGRGKQVQFYWAGGEPGERPGHTGRVWRTVHSAAIEQLESAGLLTS